MNLLIKFLLGLVVVCFSSFGQTITITSPCGATCGTISNVSRVQNASLEWEIDFTATVINRTSSPDDFQVHVKVHAPGQTIRHVRVTANRGSATNDHVVVTLFPASSTDSIPTLYELKKVGGNADLILGANRIGQLGTSSIPAEIRANGISSIVVQEDSGLTGYTGNAFATIEANLSNNFVEANVDEFVCDGNFIGSVTAGHRISTFDVYGNIGSSSSTATLTATDQIRRILSGRIWANISTTAGTSFIQRLETTVGSFTGSITTQDISQNIGGITPGFFITGDLAADVNIKGIGYYPISMTGKLPTGKTLKVGSYMTSTSGGITIGTAQGLEGQIILNSGNNTGQGWGGPVTIGPSGNQIVLTDAAPYYSQTSSQLGGGAVGLVQYHLYDADCDPANNATTPGEIFDSQFNGIVSPRAAKLRFYGPVYDADSGDKPVVVEVLVGSTWTDVTNNVRVTVQSSASTTVREITIDRDPLESASMWGSYRVTPVSGDLLCAGTTGSTVPAVASYTYYFNLLSDCNANLEDDADESAYMDEHGHHVYDLDQDGFLDDCTRDGNCPADIDGNDFVNGVDYDLYVAAYEVGC